MAEPLRVVVILFLSVAVSGSSCMARQKTVDLDTRQEALSSRYARFEKLLLQMAEYLGRTDPDRAELLMRALSRSREERITTQMDGIVELLRNEDFGDAVEGQTDLVKNLHDLLELLQSENRRSELEEEAARIRLLLKDVNKLIGAQKLARAAASRSVQPADAAPDQKKVADKTRELTDKLKAHDKNKNADPSGKPAEPTKSPDQSRKPSKGEPKAPNSSNPPTPSDQKQTPGQRELEEARKAMEKAIEALRKQQREGSSRAQDEALQKLLDSRERLEAKLRQLREEERELMLAALEARIQKMLAMQLTVNAATDNLVDIEKDKWTDRELTRSRELAQLERAIEKAAANTLRLLKEEGTSVSFPLAMQDVREDVVTVIRRLENSEVGELTVEIQADIVEALREMVLALQKEMEKGEDQQSGQSQMGSPQNANGDPVLVELIAELKMLRTLQKRVNRRTRQIGSAMEAGETDEAELREQLRRLAIRQDRLRRTAIDIARTRELQNK